MVSTGEDGQHLNGHQQQQPMGNVGFEVAPPTQEGYRMSKYHVRLISFASHLSSPNLGAEAHQRNTEREKRSPSTMPRSDQNNAPRGALVPCCMVDALVSVERPEIAPGPCLYHYPPAMVTVYRVVSYRPPKQIQSTGQDGS